MTGQRQSASVERLKAALRSWPNETALADAARLVEQLCRSEQVEAVVAFGSAVRETVASFDLDLLYVYHGTKPELRSQSGQVDLRGYRQGEVEELLARGHDLLCWSIRYGRLLCEREGYWSGLVAAWGHRLRLPSAADAERRAAKACEIFEATVQIGDVDAALEQYVTYLTHVARGVLIRGGVYPASRPELPSQLIAIGRHDLAGELTTALHQRAARAAGVERRALQYLKSALRLRPRFHAA